MTNKNPNLWRRSELIIYICSLSIGSGSHTLAAPGRSTNHHHHHHHHQQHLAPPSGASMRHPHHPSASLSSASASPEGSAHEEPPLYDSVPGGDASVYADDNW